MKKIISILLTAVLIVSSLSVSAFAYVTASSANNVLANEHAVFNNLVNTKFDADGSNSIDASDARLTLIYSAGLALDGADTTKMDTDGDGIVTAIDARNILRLSAKLDNISSYLSNEEMLTYFNAILNTAQPNNYRLYMNGIDYTESVTYTDPDGVVKSLNKSILGYTDESMDFGEMLVSTLGNNTKVYKSNTPFASSSYSKHKMPLISNSDGIDEYVSSYLTTDDITGLEYKTNQTYTFVRYGVTKDSNDTTVLDTSNVLYKESVSGLSSLTVYIKAEDNASVVHTAKAFSVEDMDSIESDVSNFTGSFDMSSDTDSGLLKMEFDMTPTLGSVKYTGAYITVYFYPDTGVIVAAYYNKPIQYTLKMYMDVYIALGILPLADAKGNVNITNKSQAIQEYYFVDNNPAHVNWSYSTTN